MCVYVNNLKIKSRINTFHSQSLMLSSETVPIELGGRGMIEFGALRDVELACLRDRLLLRW
jgi:hypothetical protein